MQFAVQMNLYLHHFPKHEKYGLALAIRRTAYEVFGLIVEAQKRYHKKTTLTQLDIRHEQLRHFLALANELGYFGRKGGAQAAPEQQAHRRYITLSKLTDDLGRMIGGWVKHERLLLQGEAS